MSQFCLLQVPHPNAVWFPVVMIPDKQHFNSMISGSQVLKLMTQFGFLLNTWIAWVTVLSPKVTTLRPSSCTAYCLNCQLASKVIRNMCNPYHGSCPPGKHQKDSSIWLIYCGVSRNVSLKHYQHGFQGLCIHQPDQAIWFKHDCPSLSLCARTCTYAPPHPSLLEWSCTISFMASPLSSTTCSWVQTLHFGYSDLGQVKTYPPARDSSLRIGTCIFLVHILLLSLGICTVEAWL